MSALSENVGKETALRAQYVQELIEADTELKQLEKAKNRPATPAWSQIDSILQDEVRAAIRGEKTVQEALSSAAKQADALLAKYAG